MVSKSKNEEPVWAKYITEDNLPTDDLRFLCEIIGLEATKQLMIKSPGQKFSIHAHCNQKYKKQYIIDNFDGTKSTFNKIVIQCGVTARYAYKVIKEYVEGEK